MQFFIKCLSEGINMQVPTTKLILFCEYLDVWSSGDAFTRMFGRAWTFISARQIRQITSTIFSLCLTIRISGKTEKTINKKIQGLFLRLVNRSLFLFIFTIE